MTDLPPIPKNSRGIDIIKQDLIDSAHLWTPDSIDPEARKAWVESDSVQIEKVEDARDCFLVKIQRFDRPASFYALSTDLVVKTMANERIFDPFKVCIRLIDGYFESDYMGVFPDGDEYNHLYLVHNPLTDKDPDAAMSPEVYKITSTDVIRTHSRDKRKQYVQFAAIYPEIDDVAIFIMQAEKTLY